MNVDLKNFYNKHSGRTNEPSQQMKENIISKLGSIVIESPTPVSPLASSITKLRRMFLHSYVLVPVVVLLFITGTTYASADSMPGDTLYPVKRQVENARILIAPSEEAKQELKETFAEKRLDEFEKVRSVEQTSNSINDQPEQRKKDNRKDNSTVVDIDRDDLSSDLKNDDARQQRQDRVRQDADKAVESLQKARENWQRKGNDERANEIDDKVRQYKQRLDGNQRGQWQQRSRDNNRN